MYGSSLTFCWSVRRGTFSTSGCTPPAEARPPVPAPMAMSTPAPSTLPVAMAVASPRPVPAASLAPRATPTPEPPIALASVNPRFLPKQVILLKPVDFVILADGKQIGSVHAAAGVWVDLVDVASDGEIEVQMGGSPADDPCRRDGCREPRTKAFAISVKAKARVGDDSNERRLSKSPY